MEENRKCERFNPVVSIPGYFELTSELTGEFRNHEEFLVKNISMGGFNLVSNYPPLIGNPYQTFVNYGREKHEFRCTIVHSRILCFQEQPESVLRPGSVYASGCEIAYENEVQKILVRDIIKNDCGAPFPAASGQ
jgi:hypothetical protein